MSNNEIYKIDKNIVREILLKIDSIGLYTMMERVSRTYFNLPKEDIYTHIEPNWRRLYNFLQDLKRNHIELFKDTFVGSGPVNNGESYGDFYELFPKHSKKLVKLYNEFLLIVDFGNYKEIKFINEK